MMATLLVVLISFIIVVIVVQMIIDHHYYCRWLRTTVELTTMALSLLIIMIKNTTGHW